MSTSTDFEYRPTTRTGRIANFVDTRVGGSSIVKAVSYTHLTLPTM